MPDSPRPLTVKSMVLRYTALPTYQINIWFAHRQVVKKGGGGEGGGGMAVFTPVTIL